MVIADTSDAARTIAIEYYRSVRLEVIERLKARDTILLAYLAAVALLLGLPKNFNLDKEYISFVIALLGFAAAASIAQHQELVTILTVYLAGEWNRSIRPQCEILPPELSEAMREARGRSFRDTVITQVTVIVAPSILAASVTIQSLPSLELSGWTSGHVFFAGGLALSLVTAFRLVSSMRYRVKFIRKHLLIANAAEVPPTEAKTGKFGAISPDIESQHNEQMN